MKIWNLVIKEIIQRKLNFTLGLISVIIAVTALAGSVFMLRIHDLQTEEIIANKQKETEERMALLKDDYRKIMKLLGFNLLILPENQNLADLYANDYATQYMSEDYVTKLSNSKMMSIRHLLPSIEQKVKWPEEKRTIILIGTRGEVPFAHRDPKEPMLIAVPKDSLVMGYELWNSIGLKVGDTVKLFDRNFSIQKCNEERGSKDDISIWVELAQAQDILNRPNQINAILALKCHCFGNNISQVRDEIKAILPGTKVIEKDTKVVTRAEARDRAALEAQQAIDAEIANRQAMKEEREKLLSILLPLILLACAVWIVLLFIINVRERKSEIGILRAIGVHSSAILRLFLIKALIMGVAGGLLGYMLAFITGKLFYNVLTLMSVSGPELFFTAIIMSTLLAVIASWVPALLASKQDPAEILREE